MPERKGRSRFLLWVACFAVILVIGWFGLNEMTINKNIEKIEKGEAIVVTLVVGDVQVKKMGLSVWRVVKIEDNLQMGDTIKTGSAAYCELQMIKRGIFRIEGSTELYLATLINKDDKINSRMKLANGGIALMPRKLKEGENFEVETSTAVAAVRGTEFTVNVNENGDTKVAVNEGTVEVKPVIKSLDEAQQKGLCNEKARDILENRIVKPVAVKSGEEINLRAEKVKDLDDSIGNVIGQVAEKEEGKMITEDTLGKTVIVQEKIGNGNKTVEKQLPESQVIALRIEQDMAPEAVNKVTMTNVENIVSSIIVQQKISEESKEKMDYLNESNIIDKVIDMSMVRFESMPSGASVYMDDIKLGITPISTLVEKGKTVKVRIAMEGYSEDIRDVSIGGSLTVNSVLSQVQTIQTNNTMQTNTNTVKIIPPAVAVEVKKLPGELDWQKPLPLKLESAYKEPADPVIYGGKIFISKNNRLFIVSIEGKLIKTVNVAEEGAKLTRPSVSDDVVYVGSDSGGIYAYTLNGELLWNKDAGSEKYGASPTAMDGIVAIPSIDKGVMVYNKGGGLVTQIESDSVYSAPLVLDKGNTVVFATESGNIVSYDIEKKSQNWSKGYNERFLYPLVGDKEIIAVSRADGKVLAVKPADGSLLWTEVFTEMQKTRINPGFVKGKLILANNETKSVVIVLDAMTGKIVSKTSFDNETITPPFILDKFIYIGTESGKVFSYNVSRQKFEWTYDSSGNSISLVVADRQGIYALSKDGMLRIVK